MPSYRTRSRKKPGEPPAKPGPEPKGDRTAYTLRAPRDHMDYYKAAAVAAGLPLGDYLALVLARSHDLEEPAYLHRPNNNQPDLGISVAS
jgi:hypothetical protein